MDLWLADVSSRMLPDLIQEISPIEDITHHPANPLGEFFTGSDQAGDQVAVRCEVIEMPRLEQHSGFAEQRDGHFFVRAEDRDTQNGCCPAST